MGDTLIGLLIGWAIAKFLASGEDFLSNIFHVSHRSDEPGPSPSPTLTTTVVNFPTTTPSGLPPFPSGWKAVDPVTSAIVARAEALLPVMQLGQVKYEQGAGGTWIAYYKHKFGGKTGVTAHEPRQALPAAQPPIYQSPTAPVMTTAPSSAAPIATPVQTPGEYVATPDAFPPAAARAQPVIRKGSRGEAVKVWQRVLGLMDDGNFGRGTEAATKAWQSSHGLKPDGVVGPDTWATVPGAA
jgi:putative peptidoglycan binding protein